MFLLASATVQQCFTVSHVHVGWTEYDILILGCIHCIVEVDWDVLHDGMLTLELALNQAHPDC